MSEVLSEPGSPTASKNGSRPKKIPEEVGQVTTRMIISIEDTNDFVASRRFPNIRLRKEEADLYNKNNMDIRHDSRVFRGHVLGAYLHYWYYHCHPDSLFQGGHRHREYPK